MDSTGERQASSTDTTRADATGSAAHDQVQAGNASEPVGQADLLDRLYAGMSCPQYGLEDVLFEEVATGFCRRVTYRFFDRFCDRAGGLLATHGSGLVRSVRAVMEQGVPFAAAWSPVFGTLGESLRGQGHVAPPEAAARLGLWLAACGHPGCWEVALDAPARLLWGPWLLPACQRLRLESDGRRARLILHMPDAPPRHVELTCEAGAAGSARAPYAWTWAEEPGPRAPRLLQERHSVLFLFDAARHAPELAFLRDDMLPFTRAASVVAQYQEALEVLRQHAPVYLPWVDRVMRYIIPLRARGEGHIVSGSSADQPGVSHISFDNSPVALAEMLVHEASHHYFYLVSRLGPVQDGSDPVEYYSPVKRCGRPIHFILLAYHAFANVMLFYRECLASGCPDPGGYLARNAEELMPQLRTLEEGLRQTHALTRMGRGLWAPLRERLG